LRLVTPGVPKKSRKSAVKHSRYATSDKHEVARHSHSSCPSAPPRPVPVPVPVPVPLA